MTSLETFLPSDPRPSYDALFHAYGKWWQAQPSLSGYARHYTTDSDQYLIVWEGALGAYDPYGDFANDDQFYNYVVKGPMIFFYIRRHQPVEVSTSGFMRRYQTSAEMRASMLAEWTQLQPTLGSQGEALRAFMADNAEKVIELLKGYGDQWMQTQGRPTCRSLVYQTDRQIYLCLWEGLEQAVQPRHAPDPDLEIHMQTRPRIEWPHIQRYAEIRVSFMRLPVRLELHRRMWTRKPGSHSAYQNMTGRDTLRTFDELAEEPILANMRFYDPDGPVEDDL